jgi:hypothetical protein
MNMPEMVENASYREHKKESVRTFLQWIEEHRRDQIIWAEKLRGETKRDDLCDAFWLMISGMSQWRIDNKISTTEVEQDQEQEEEDDDTRDSMSSGEVG